MGAAGVRAAGRAAAELKPQMERMAEKGELFNDQLMAAIRLSERLERALFSCLEDFLPARCLPFLVACLLPGMCGTAWLVPLPVVFWPGLSCAILHDWHVPPLPCPVAGRTGTTFWMYDLGHSFDRHIQALDPPAPTGFENLPLPDWGSVLGGGEAGLSALMNLHNVLQNEMQTTPTVNLLPQLACPAAAAFLRAACTEAGPADLPACLAGWLPGGSAAELMQALDAGGMNLHVASCCQHTAHAAHRASQQCSPWACRARCPASP